MTQGGGLLQLVATGKQDVFLTGNPSVSWFKFVYRRYTNFAIESQRMYFDGTPNFGQKISCLVPRNGDLLGPIFLKLTLPQLYDQSGNRIGYVNSPGHSLIQEISVQIGEQEIDKQTGQFMEIWSSLTVDASQRAGFDLMTGTKPGYPFIDNGNAAPDVTPQDVSGCIPRYIFSRENGNPLVDVSGVRVSGTSFADAKIRPDVTNTTPPPFANRFPRNYDDPIMGPVTLYIPLRFWFNKNPGLYLPLLAMQYHPVRINVTLSPLQSMFYTKQLYRQETPNTPCNAGISVQPAQLDIQLWGDYVFLDIPERRRFVSAPLEYLIEQVQYSPPLAIPANSRTATLGLNFNHPIKELIWTIQRNVMVSRHEYFNWSSLGFYEIEMNQVNNINVVNGVSRTPNRTDLMVNAKVQLDGQDRFDARDPVFFRLVQPYQRHTTIPSDRYIYVYSFALRPEDLQPSGTLNASRIDNFVLQVGLQEQGTTYCTSAIFGDMTAYVYATNYNVLRVIDGYAGLLFSV